MPLLPDLVISEKIEGIYHFDPFLNGTLQLIVSDVIGYGPLQFVEHVHDFLIRVGTEVDFALSDGNR